MDAVLAYTIKFVADMDAAVDFHSTQLGLKLRFASPEWTEFDTGTTTLALHRASAEHPDGSCQLGFRVADVDRFCAERSAHGVEVVQAPTDLHGQRIAKLRYPDGSEFSVSGNGG
jgi:lactoylglutathione lyase